MNRSQDRLSEALRELADASPRVAPPELKSTLKDAFARHHTRRRQKKAAFVVALAACLPVSIVLLRHFIPTQSTTAGKAPAQFVQIPSPSREIAATNLEPAKTEPRHAATSHLKAQTNKMRKTHKREVPLSASTAASGDFVALPTFDPAIPVAQSRLVRMELPGPELQLMGYPIDGRLLNRHVLTDVLVGQDGMPYAVRLVQTSNTH